MHTIYLIWNRTSDKYYVGQTSKEVKIRWTKHKSGLRCVRHGNSHLQRAWDKYGQDAFEFYVLDIVETKAEADAMERALKKWFSDLGICYNICDGGEGRTGPLSEETKRKISAALKGRKPANLGTLHSPEVRKKAAEANRSEEYREKLRIARTGKKQSPETIEKRRAKQLGSKRSEEARKRMSGRPCSEETREKISRVQKGRIISEEHRRKIRESWIERRQTKENEHSLWVPIRVGLTNCGTYNEWTHHECAARYKCVAKRNADEWDEQHPAFAEQHPVIRFARARQLPVN